MEAVNNLSFKALLKSRELGADDLLQLYMHYKEMDDLLGFHNPFQGELIAIKEILDKEYPDIWAEKS